MGDISTLAPLSGRLQAICLSRPIEVWTTDDANSGRSYTEQGPRPGLPLAAQNTHAALHPSGTVEGTADFNVRCQHGGVPGQVDHGMTVAAKRSDEDLYAGWEQPGVTSDNEAIDAALTGRTPDVVAMPDGTLVACTKAGLSARVYTKAPGATSWTNRGPVTTTPSGETPEIFYPSLLVVEEEVFLLAWREGVAYDPATSTDPAFFISVWGSSDSGATWRMVQDFATIEEDVRDDTIVATDPATGAGSIFACGRIRAAYRDNEVVVFAHLKGHRLDDHQDRIRQWAGASLAARLDHIEDYPTADPAIAAKGHALPDVVATPWGFFVAWLRSNATAPITCSIGSAWQPISTANATAMDLPATIYVNGGWSAVGAASAEVIEDDDIAELALAYDPAGTIWLYTAASDGASAGAGVQYAYYSTDGGSTWTPGHATIPAVTDISGFWYYPEDVSAGVQGNYPLGIGATWWRGMAVLVHGSEGTAAGSGWLAATYLGGWTDLTLPFERHGVRIGHRMGWLRTYHPFEVPDVQGYTTTQTGTQTSTLASGGHAMTTGDGAAATGTNWYKHTGIDNGTLQLGHGESTVSVPQTQGTGTTCDIGQRMRLASTNHGVEMEIIRTATGIFVRDVVASTALGSVTGLTSAGRYAVRWGMSMTSDTGANRALQVWYRLANGSSREERRWTLIGAWSLSDDAGAGGTVPHHEWGHINASGDTTQNQSIWYNTSWSFPYYASGASPGAFATWESLDQAGGDNPAKLPGRPLGTERDYVLDGLQLAGRRGPGAVGDIWKIPVSGDHEVARALTLDTPSPRVHHRSVDDSADVVIPWAADADRPFVEDAEHPPLLALRGWCNWRLGYLQYRTVAGAWTTLATIDNRVLQGVSFTRTGRFLRASSTGSTVYLHRDEVDPYWTAEWDDGGGTTRYRHLLGNSPGRWSSATTGPRARLELPYTASGDPTSGGTLSLWSPEFTALVPGVTATAWRIKIDSTYPTADGDYRTKLAWCEAHVLAQPPSWGRGYTALPGHERVALEGDLGVRVDRAPAARELRMAWDDSVDESEIGSSSTVRYVVPFSTSSEPAACVGELPRSIVRALERQAGRPAGWVVWDRTTLGAVVLRRRHEQLWGTVEAAPDLEVVLGQEGTTEVVRMATLKIREER